MLHNIIHLYTVGPRPLGPGTGWAVNKVGQPLICVYVYIHISFSLSLYIYTYFLLVIPYWLFPPGLPLEPHWHCSQRCRRGARTERIALQAVQLNIALW